MLEQFLKYRSDIAAILVRVIIGFIFIKTGWLKISDMPNTVLMFQQLHIPTFLAYVVSYGELIAGAVLISGFYAEIAALFLSAVMIGAIYLTSKLGFVVFALPLSVFAGVISIIGFGPGAFTINKLFAIDKIEKTVENQ